MGRWYRSEAENAERIDAVTMMMSVMMTAMMTGRNTMDFMWNRENGTWSVQQTLSRKSIVAKKWTLLTVVVTVKDKTKWDKVKRCTGGKIF